MKPEYKKMLEELTECYLLTYGLDPKDEWPFSDKECIRRGLTIYDLIESGDMEVLHGLMGVLTMKVEVGDGVFDGTFPQIIFHHYTGEQIADAVFEKFDAIYDNYNALGDTSCIAEILEDICSTLLYVDGEEGWKNFRERFNQHRSRHAERFLNGMEEMTDDPEQKAQIEMLREDMKKWGRDEGSEQEEKAEAMAKDDR